MTVSGFKEVAKPKKKFSEKVSEGLDNVVGIFSPQAAIRRKYFRWMNNWAGKHVFSSYRGAEKDRLKKNWLPGGGSPDEDLLPELADLRERSRDLNRNDAHASSITGTMQTDIIGTGFNPQSRVDKESLNLTDAAARIFQKKAERIWEKWCPFADAANRMNFHEMQLLVLRQILENGEVLVLPLMIDEPGRPYNLALQVVEADRLQTPLDKKANKNIRYGVEIGERGEPKTYWIRRTHPGDSTLRRETPTASEFIGYSAKNKIGRPNVFHLYWVKRPGQTRGEPFFAPVISIFKDLADYMEAELVAARVAACFAALITKTDPYNAAIGRADSIDSSGKKLTEMEPGMLEYLAPGESVTQLKPERPGNTFDSFVERALRSAGAGLGLPYEVVAKDFSKTNYSSARAALLQAYRLYRCWQVWIAAKFCQPVYEFVLEEAYLREELPAEDFFAHKLDFARARWIPTGFGWVDPTKEIAAARDSIEGGISTLADECAAQGRDWEEVMEQRAREEEKRKELGLPDMRQSAGKVKDMPEDGHEDGHDDEHDGEGHHDE